MLPPHEGPEPGYAPVCFPCTCISAMRSLAHRSFPEPPAHNGPNSSLSQAYDVIPPRHLAPTVGPAVALAGVFIRTGNLLKTGERVLSGLMQRFGSQHQVFDNEGYFGQGPMPAIGNHFTFGTFDVYVAIAQPFVYPQVVHVAEDPPCGSRPAHHSPREL